MEGTMSKLTVFNQVTLDGYFTGENGDLSWAHRRSANADPEWQSFIAENAKGGGGLIFGRKTYEMMASYWPTPEAKKNDAAIAEQMNQLPKVVFSRTMDEASWENTKLVRADLPGEIRKMKQTP
jgi:dihydrofolate reductase